MLTDLLATVAEGGKILLEEEDYLLARVVVDGRSKLVEISVGYKGGIPLGEWPTSSGILHPDSEIHPADKEDTRILLFSPPGDSELYLERLIREGSISERDALKAGKQMLAVLRRLHDAGHRIGYLGPENILVSNSGDHYILAGGRGIPDTPFSPPEAVGRIAEDPRSDIYALGLLIFRLIAGSDNKNVQIEAWNNLSSGVMKLLEKMVTPDADERFPNLMLLSRRMSATVPLGGESSASTGRPGASRSKGRRFPVWGYIVVILAVVLAVVLIGWNGKGTQQDQPSTAPDTSAADTSSAVESPMDTVEVPENPPVQQTGLDPVIWISNCSGQQGLASEFRQGPAADYSSVYACTGSSRGNSILLARRLDPSKPLSEQEELVNIARQLSAQDTALTVLPVDITILLGTDLIDDQVTPGILTPSSAPAGTLYVDIANNGVGGVYGGAGAATWVRSVINGYSLMIDGSEWTIRVVDFRDGDMMNDELGIPRQLGNSGFLFRHDRPVLSSAVSQLKEALIDGSPAGASGQEMPEPPDIWILLGH